MVRKTDDDRKEPEDRRAFLLRLPPDVMEELRAWSAQELRSLNGHIEYLLRAALRQRRGARPSRDDQRPSRND